MATASLSRFAAWAAESAGEDIHVTLRGEDLAAMASPPIRLDEPFDPPEWTREAALSELIRVDRPGTSGLALAAPISAPETVSRTQKSAEPGAVADSGFAVAPGIVSRIGSGAAPTRIAADAGVSVAAMPEPLRAPSVGTPTLPAVPSRSAASLGLEYRPGHRVQASGSVALELPRLRSSLDLRVQAPDDAVPSSLTSAGGLRIDMRHALSAGPAGLALRGVVLARSSDGEDSAAGTLATALTLLGARGRGLLSVEAAGSRSAASGETRLAVHPRVEGLLSLGTVAAIEAALDASIVPGDPASGAGYAYAAVRISGPSLLILSIGVGVETDGASASLLPYLALETGPGASAAIGLEVGPYALLPEALADLLLLLGPPPVAIETERGFAARAYAEAEPSDRLALRLDLEYADGMLWVVEQRALGLLDSRRLAASLTAKLSLALGVAAHAGVEAAARWAEGETVSLSDLRARVGLAAGFWDCGLAAIMRSSAERPSGLGAARSRSDAMDLEPGLQVAAEVSRLFPGRGSVSAEARLLIGDASRDTSAAFQIGCTIGVR